MTSPVLQALSQAREQDRLAGFQHHEAAILAALTHQFGQRPVEQSPARLVTISAFLSWCEAKCVRSCPAQPATIAQFVLEHAGLGIDAIAEIVEHLVDLHEAHGLANPAATWIVAEALDRVSGSIEPPRSWPKKHWWRFGELPCILRRYISGRAREQDRVVAGAQREAAAARRELAALKAASQQENGNGDRSCVAA